METPDTFSLELQPVEGASADGFDGYQPGQFNMLYAFGAGEVPVSISGDPGDRSRLVHTVRSVGSVTKALERLAPGDAVGVRGPFGRGWPLAVAEGHDLVVVAGGIGLAPLRPVVYRVLAQRSRFGRVVLLYGARRPQEMLYVEELRAWRSRLDVDVHVTVDRATEAWKGAVGFVTALIAQAPLSSQGSVAMVCGPELMMRYAVLQLVKVGVDESRIYLSLERNMNCGVGLCGHCQLGPSFVCRDGPVYPYPAVRRLLQTAEA